MRVGFITQLLWDRYGAFWRHLLEDTDIEVRLAKPESVQAQLQDARLHPIPGWAFRLAGAQALALGDCDLLLVPDLNPASEVARGGGQDPWIASFPEALEASISGLPPVRAVPASLDTDLEPLAVELLLNLSRDPGKVRRVWARHRGRLPTQSPAELSLPPASGSHEVVGLVGQPWLLTERLERRLQEEGTTLVSQSVLSPARLREEGWRADERLIGTDAEVLGAARYFGRRGGVDRLMLVLDKTSGVDGWLAVQVERRAHKPLSKVYLQDLAAADELPALLLEPPK